MTAVAASTNSEELILELFDVLERCPASARDAATDAALEAIAKAGAPEEPEEPVPEPIKSEPSFMQPRSAYAPVSRRPARPISEAAPGAGTDGTQRKDAVDVGGAGRGS